MLLTELNFILESDDESKNVSKAPAPGELGEFVTTNQAANILNCTPGYIRKLIMEGKLKSLKPDIGRRDNYLKLSAVKAFATKNRKKTGRPKGI